MVKGVSGQELAEAIGTAERELRQLAQARGTAQARLQRLTNELIEKRGGLRQLLALKGAQPEEGAEGSSEPPQKEDE